MLLGDRGRELWYTTSSASGATVRTRARADPTMGRTGAGMLFRWSFAVTRSAFFTSRDLRSLAGARHDIADGFARVLTAITSLTHVPSASASEGLYHAVVDAEDEAADEALLVADDDLAPRGRERSDDVLVRRAPHAQTLTGDPHVALLVDAAHP